MRGGQAGKNNPEPPLSQPVVAPAAALTTTTPSGRKPRAKPICWEDHPEWTNHAISYLIQKPPFHMKLFSDLTSDAKAEDRKKVQAKDGKLIMYGVLAEHIFTGFNVDQEHCEEYGKDPTQFAWSTQQQFAR